MSKSTAWTIVAVVVVAAIGSGIWWWVDAHNAPMNSENAAAGTASSTASSTLPQGDSNQSIDQEMTDINAQMNGLSSDSASIDQSLNDQPVQQAQ